MSRTSETRKVVDSINDDIKTSKFYSPEACTIKLLAQISLSFAAIADEMTKESRRDEDDGK